MPPPASDAIDLDVYCQRISYRGDRTATLQTLEAIHYSHTQAIAFENLDPLLGQPVRLDLGSLQQKLIQAGRGGYCFEQNTLFRAILLHLGFQVTSLAARVRWGVPEDVVTARSHMVLLVTLGEQRYIADVGFGGQTLTTPMWLVPGIEQPTSHEPFRLICQAEQYVLQAKIGSAWKSLYQFDLHPQYPPDYEVSNWYVSTHPSSLFVNTLIAARPASDRRYALRDNQFAIHHRNGTTEHHVLTTSQELCGVLTNEFRLALPIDSNIESVLQQFVK